MSAALSGNGVFSTYSMWWGWQEDALGISGRQGEQ